MRVVICDEDALLREMVEALVTRLGHEIIGITDTTAAGVALIEAGRPEVVIYDMALGYNTGAGNMLAFARGATPGSQAQSYLDNLHANWAKAGRPSGG